jgi:tetratricopeptide (TPR) repeat protein
LSSLLSSNDPWADVDAAVKARDEGRLDEAVAKLHLALERLDDHLPVHEAMVFTLTLARRYREAREEARVALARFGESPRCRACLGSIDMAEGQPAAALPHLRAAQASLGFSQDLAHQLADALEATKDQAGLEEQFYFILRHAPDDETARGRLARALLARGAFNHVIVLLREAGSLSPALALERGRAELACGDKDAALDTFRTAAAQEGVPRDLLLEYGLLLRKLGAPEESANQLHRAAALDPTSRDLQTEAAYASQIAGRLDDAEAAYQRALALDPHTPAALLGLGQIAVAHGHSQAAEAYFRQAIAASPEQSHPYVALGDLLVASGQGLEAWDLAESAPAVVTRDPAFRLWRYRVAQTSAPYPVVASIVARPAGTESPEEAVARAQTAIVFGELQLADRIAISLPSGPEMDSAKILLRAEIEDARHELQLTINLLEADESQSLERFALLARLYFKAGTMPAADQYLRRYLAAEAALGLPIRPSQTLLGQLVNESSITPTLRYALRQADHETPQHLVSRRHALVRDFPNSTPAAIGYLSALAAIAEPVIPTTSVIPDRIGLLHDEEDDPRRMETLAESWRQANPQVSVQVFTTATAVEFLKDSVSDAAARAFLAAPTPEHALAVLRYGFLLNGGFFVGPGRRAVASIDELDLKVGALMFESRLGSLDDDLIGAQPHHPIIRRALDDVLVSIERKDEDVAWLSCGPGLLTRAAAFVLATHIDVSAAILPPWRLRRLTITLQPPMEL